jgi:hypothetical protein
MTLGTGGSIDEPVRRRPAEVGFWVVFFLVVAFGCLYQSRQKAQPTVTPSPAPTALTMVGPDGAIPVALRRFREDTGAYPEALDQLLNTPDDARLAAAWRGPYLQDPLALYDPWGRILRYKAPGEFSDEGYDLWSVGPDGRDATYDDIGTWLW